MASALRWKIAQKAELKWWRNYLQTKPKVLYQEWKASYWNDFLKEYPGLVSVHETQKILDAGCGPAGIFMILKDHQVTAIDPLISHYEALLDHFETAAYPFVKFINSPIESFETTETYDLIFCLNAINHVREITKSVKKLRTLLKPGGKIAISIDAHNYQTLKGLFRLLPFDILHPHQYDLVEYQEMFSNAGMKIIQSTVLKNRFIFNYHLIIAEKSNYSSIL